MPATPTTRNVAFLFTDGVEEAELLHPLGALADAGVRTTLIAPRRGRIRMVRGDLYTGSTKVETLVAEAEAVDYDALVLPGGVANPDRLRTDADAVRLVRGFFDAGKPIAAICHGPWLLIEADVVRGRTVTAWPSLRTDLRNAGATWVDEEVHVDGGLITSRRPDDLPAFSARLLEELERLPVPPRPARTGS